MMINLRWISVWQRNFLVWRKLVISSLIGNFGDPLIYLLALGYGFGSFVGKLDGLPYLVFLASGIVCSSAVSAASFEATYGAYTRMSFQKTWEAILSTPLAIQDVVLGEIMWAATKGLINATAILIVAALLGLVSGWQALWSLPIIFLLSICFAALALIIMAIARSFDFFVYYFTLFITPMMLLSGVFFPLQKMPIIIQWGVQLFPLYHAIALIRPLMTQGSLHLVWLHLGVMIIYTGIAYWFAVLLAKRKIFN